MNQLELILLIDDSDADNHYHRIVISRAKIGSTIKSINSSIDALDYLRKAISQDNDLVFPLPQLVLIDINMPALNGFELLDKLRQVPDPKGRKKDMKIFMLTGSLNPDDKAMAIEKYADIVYGFYVKPLTENAIIEIRNKHFSAEDII
jgi:CheY-like chemotaxis protein